MSVDNSYLYLYGIIQEPRQKEFDLKGIDEGKVYTINEADLSVVVSDIKASEVDPTRKNMKIHATVQEYLLKDYALLPMGFGMVVTDKNEVINILRANYKSLHDEIKYLEGKIEAVLKVYWNQDAVRKELEERSLELSKIKKKIKESSSDIEVQHLLIEAGMLVEKLIEEWKGKCVDKVYSSLKKIAVSSKLDDPVGLKNILNASFLLEKTKQDEFMNELYRLDAEFEGKLDFKCVCPLPPYNFVGISL